MNFPIEVESKLINPGIANDKYPYCISFTYFQGQQVIAYGSLNKVIIVSNYLKIIASLCQHEPGSYVTAVAWAQHSGKISSCGTDYNLNIWEPDKDGWHHVKKLKMSSIGKCISWNFLDKLSKLCIASDDFSIYDYQSIIQPGANLQPIFIEHTKTNYCAFSRDSRFILTLQQNKQDIHIWYHGPSSTTDYRRLILTHPTKVISISWRLSEDLYERCSFMSITEDGVARIWIETCVLERLSFHVAASIPTHPIAAGSFIMTTSKMISSKQISLTTDNFANGNGHIQIRDKNSRFSSVPDPREIERNKSWVLLLHRDLKLSIWELSGLSLSVRSTPKLKRVLLIDQTRTQFLNLERAFKPKFSCFFATYSKQYQLIDNNDGKKQKKKSIVSLIIEDQRSHTLIASDIVTGTPNPFSIIGLLKGHQSEIKMFKIHDTQPFMISIDESGTASFWKVDDSDVYDPYFLIEFKFTIGSDVEIADFVKNSNQIIGYRSNEIFLLNYDPIKCISGRIFHLHSNFKSKGKIIDLNVMSTNLMNQIFFVALFTDVFYICCLEDQKVNILYHLICDENDTFTTGIPGYLSMSDKEYTKCIYKIATKKKIISIKLALNEKEREKPIVWIKSFEIEMEDDEEIVNVIHSRPSTMCILTHKHIYMGRQLMSKTSKFEIFEKFPLDEDAEPHVSSCLSNGFLAVACKNEIKLFFTGRKSHEFTESLLSLNLVSSCKAENVSALGWMGNGILIYSSYGQIFALTKFMNTCFLDSNIKLPTIHHSLVSLTLSVPDLHSTVISPLAISGRINLVSKMIKYYDKNFNEKDCKMVFKKYILDMPEETDKEGKHLCSKNFLTHIESLIEKIENENEKIESKDIVTKKKSLFMNNDLKTENNRFLYILKKLKLISSISFDIIDRRALVYYRAVLFSEKFHIPFDIVCCALMSHEKVKLLSMLDIQSWDEIERCGVVYWCDLSKLKETLVSISIRDFGVNRNLSILFLVLFKRFRALHHLFSSVGDEARASFFIRDFSTPKNIKSALNNAYSALSKHSFHVCCAMFILAGKFDTALNVCNNNIHDYSLSYLLAYFSDNKERCLNYVKNVLIKEAVNKNDLAAVSLFNNIAFNKEIDLSQRMRQMQPGFFYNDMRIFGDIRFCVCEVMKPTIETVREVSRSLLLAGHFFLATQFINYLNQSEEITSATQTPAATASNTANISSNVSCKFDSDIIRNVQIREGNQKKRKMIPSISFQSFRKLSNCEDDEDDEVLSDNIEIHRKVTDDKFEENEDDFEDDDLNDKRKHRHSNNKKKEGANKPEFRYEDIFGYSNYLDDFDDFDESSTFDDLVDQEIDENEDDSESDSDNFQSEFITNFRDTFQQSLVRYHSMNEILDQINQKEFTKEENTEESCEINLSESSQSESDFNTKLVLFNITRLRLETFLEQSLDLKEVEEIIPTIGKEIEKFDNCVTSVHPHLRDFLIRMCQRCAFIYRRLLLLSDSISKLKYIVSLCHSISNLPDLLISSFLTSQQVAQVSHTIWGISTYFNKELVGQAYPEIRSIVAFVLTGFFIVGCHNMNSELLLALFEQQMNFSRNKFKFPQTLIDQIKVEIAFPENISVTKKREEYDYNSVSFISKKKENIFSYPSIKQDDLYHFMWPLFDMMLIDEFVCLIEKIQIEKVKYQPFLTSLKKLMYLNMQFFIYSFLKYPVFLHITSLKKVTIQNKTVDKLFKFMLNKNDREKKIYSFCREMIGNYSDIHSLEITNFKEGSRLQNMKKIARFKGGVTSFCMRKDLIWAATSQGLKHRNMKDEEITSEVSDLNDQNNELNEFVYDEEVAETYEPNIQSDETLISYSISQTFPAGEIPLKASDTCPLFHHRSDRIKPSKKPCYVIPHPSEDYMLVTDYDGNIYARKFDIDENQRISIFHSKLKSKCTALGFQTAGTMFAAAQLNYVSLFSFCLDNCSRPYVTYDTHGSSVQALEFVQGTGIFATCQKPSIEFDANIVFWDSILSPGSAMISSMNVKKIGNPTSIVFSPKYNEVVVGTSKGSLVTIDTRKYEILKILKNVHEKGIHALAVDPNESYCVTGGNEGTVKVWDMRSLNHIAQMKNVHTPRMVKKKQKWKSLAVTGIEIRNDIIYTSGLDGHINRIEFS
ncbi:hypothetical protein M9Y10_030502 [Tritrichomonas musculus]|uniref:RAVE complex protein Rav1 C-terminal domain-containing protein n=1 Tax=Tritrichomonas musculus TaxID=1915356 RepID=A0ABR2H5K1_9EUKA